MFGFWKRSAKPIVRDLSGELAPACARLHAAAFAHAWSAADFERMIAAGNMVGDAALKPPNGPLTGFILSRRAADEAEILTIAVDVRARRGGVGRALLAHHIARLAGLGVRALFLEVEAENAAALALYRAYDFLEVGRREGYYAKPEGARAAALALRRAM